MASTKLLQLYRNSNLYENLEAAKTALEANAQKADGEILIARYKDSKDAPKALVGIYNGMSGQSATITYLEGVNISESSTVSDAVQAAIDAAVATETSRAETAESELQSTLTSAIEALDYTDTAVGGSFVTSVSEEDGIISVTRAAIASDDKTVTVISNTDGSVDLAVNIDGTTIQADKDSGTLSVASSALTQYVGANAIAISEPDEENEKTVSLVIDENDVVLSQDESGLKTTLGVNYDSDTKMVQLTGIDGKVISSFDATEFIYDGIIKEVSLVQEDDKGNKGEFIKITFYTKPDESGEMGTEDVYLDVTDLTDVYVAGDGINIEQGNDGYVVSVKVDSNSENFLSVGENGVNLSGVQDAIDAASAAATTVVTKDENASHLIVTPSEDETTGATTYTIGESDIASATTVSNIVTSAGLNSDGTLTDVTLPGNASTLVDAITELESEIKADETSLAISSSDSSITVTTSDEGTDVIVALETEDGDNYVADMIVKGSNGGLALNSVIDCGEY